MLQTDVSLVLDELNPWQRTGAVPDELLPGPERPLAEFLWHRLVHNQPRRHQLILGPRRVGKTTALYQTVAHLLDAGISPSQIHWLKMDHPKLIEEDLGDLVKAALESCEATDEHPAFVMIDEIVYGEKWDHWLKTFHDLNWPVRVAATASASGVAKSRHAESGVGRWEEQYLTPYSFYDFLHLVGRSEERTQKESNEKTPPTLFPKDTLFPTAFPPASELEIDVADTLCETLRLLPRNNPPDPSRRRLLQTFMLLGGFPEIITDEQRDESGTELKALIRAQRVLRSEIIDRVIYKDIQLAAEVRNPKRLERLLYAAGGQIAELFVPTNMSNDLDIPVATVETYLSHLEKAFLIFMLTNYSSNEVTTQKRGRKIYFYDGAVRNAALQRGLIDDNVEKGHLLENLAATSLNTLANNASIRIYHWRDGKNEVDLIYDDPRKPLAFEITKSRKPHGTGLSAISKRHKKFVGNCYIVRPDAKVVHPDEDNIGTLPFDLFLLAMGAQTNLESKNRLGVA